MGYTILVFLQKEGNYAEQHIVKIARHDINWYPLLIRSAIV